MWEARSFSRSWGQMVTHVQAVERGNGAHLEVILAQQDTRQSGETEKDGAAPGSPTGHPHRAPPEPSEGRHGHFLKATPAAMGVRATAPGLRDGGISLRGPSLQRLHRQGGLWAPVSPGQGSSKNTWPRL